jgi:hypothetical protein
LGTRKGLKRNKKPYVFLFSEFCEAKLHWRTNGFLLERKARFFAAEPQKMRPNFQKKAAYGDIAGVSMRMACPK